MRRIVLLITAAAMMAAMLAASAIPALADHRDLGNVTCDVLTNIPENPDMCIVDPDSIPTGESFRCDNVLSEVAGRTGSFCVADVGRNIGYLVPLGP